MIHTTPTPITKQPIGLSEDSYSSYSSSDYSDTEEPSIQTPIPIPKSNVSPSPSLITPETKGIIQLVGTIQLQQPNDVCVKRNRDPNQTDEPPLKKPKEVVEQPFSIVPPEKTPQDTVIQRHTTGGKQPRPIVGNKGPRSIVMGHSYTARSAYGGKTLPPRPVNPYVYDSDSDTDEEEENEEDEEDDEDEEDATAVQPNSNIVDVVDESLKTSTTEPKPKKKNSLWTSTIQPQNRKSQRTPEKLIEKFTKKTRKVSCAENACRTFIKKFVSFQPNDIIPLLRDIFQILRPTPGTYRSFLNEFEKTNCTTFDCAVAEAVQKKKD
jgi:hypothetical protein